MTSVLIVRKPFLLLTCCCCWRVKDERDREEPIYSFVKRGEVSSLLNPPINMPPTLEALEAGDPWPKPMIGQWMEIVNTFLAVNDVKKPTFSSSFTSNRKTFWNTCAHTKELNFLLPYHLHPPCSLWVSVQVLDPAMHV